MPIDSPASPTPSGSPAPTSAASIPAGARGSPAPSGPLAGVLATCALNHLAASGLNPRRTFDAAELTELAESIAAKGVLQNLVVRETRSPPRARGLAGGAGARRYEVLAGERRLRALAQLAESGRWDPSAETVPVRIVEADDAAGMALAVLENLQRADVPPLEEAEGFARLVGLGWETDRIAVEVRRSRRHVQLRLQLANDLEPAVKKALAGGEIQLAQARALAGLPKKTQADGVKMAKSGWAADELRDRLLHDKPKVADAPFDLALYDGAFIGDAEDPDRRFADAARFHALVGEEAERRAAWIGAIVRREFHRLDRRRWPDD